MATFSGRHATYSDASAAHEAEFLKNAKLIAVYNTDHPQVYNGKDTDVFWPAERGVDDVDYLASTPSPTHWLSGGGHNGASSLLPVAALPARRSLSASTAANAAAVAKYITKPVDDCRGHMPIRAWGCRRVKPVDAAIPVSHATRLPAHGRLNKAALQTVASLPRSAVSTDPVVKAEPKRACGGHTFTLPYHKQYNYYKYYGNAGQNALSSAHHNFPNGSVPSPSSVYSAGALAAASTASARDHVQVSEGYARRYGTIDRPATSCRDGATQTPMTTVNYDHRVAHRSLGEGVAAAALSRNFGYGGGLRPPRSASVGVAGPYSTSANVIGSRYGV